MCNIKTGAERMPNDLSQLGFLAMKIGRVITMSITPGIAGDSFEIASLCTLLLNAFDRVTSSIHLPVFVDLSIEIDVVCSFLTSPVRRGLAIASSVDICSCYVHPRHAYFQPWIKFFFFSVPAPPLPPLFPPRDPLPT